MDKMVYPVAQYYLGEDNKEYKNSDFEALLPIIHAYLRISLVKGYNIPKLIKELSLGYMTVVHPGSIKGLNLSDCVDNIVTQITSIYYDDVDKKLGMLCLENCAESSKIFTTLTQLSKIMNLLSFMKDKKGNPLTDRIGVCIDTCHLHQAGEYNLGIIKDIDRFFSDFKRLIGMKYLKVIHLNDSKRDFGEGADRHENLGKGTCWSHKEGKEALLHFLSYVKNVPKILEVKDFELSMKFIE